MSEPSYRLRFPKPWKMNRSESNPSHLGIEQERSEQERLVYLSPTAVAQFRTVLTLVSQDFPTPSLQSRPRFYKKVTALFKHTEAVDMAFVLQEIEN